MKPGDPVPDLPLLRADGTPTALSSCYGDSPSLLLVFLRHLA